MKYLYVRNGHVPNPLCRWTIEWFRRASRGLIKTFWLDRIQDHIVRANSSSKWRSIRNIIINRLDLRRYYYRTLVVDTGIVRHEGINNDLRWLHMNDLLINFTRIVRVSYNWSIKSTDNMQVTGFEPWPRFLIKFFRTHATIQQCACCLIIRQKFLRERWTKRKTKTKQEKRDLYEGKLRDRLRCTS